MVETELKFLVAQEEFFALVTRLKEEYHLPIKAKAQINYYYDTPDHALNREQITCRIRSKSGVLKGQFKAHENSDEHKSIETDFHVEDVPGVMIREGRELWYQGALLTERISLAVSEYVTIELDVNYYNGCRDFEAEIEYEQNHAEEACMLALNLGLVTPNKISKSERFFRTLQNK